MYGSKVMAYQPKSANFIKWDPFKSDLVRLILDLESFFFKLKLDINLYGPDSTSEALSIIVLFLNRVERLHFYSIKKCDSPQQFFFSKKKNILHVLL